MIINGPFLAYLAWMHVAIIVCAVAAIVLTRLERKRDL